MISHLNCQLSLQSQNFINAACIIFPKALQENFLCLDAHAIGFSGIAEIICSILSGFGPQPGLVMLRQEVWVE